MSVAFAGESYWTVGYPDLFLRSTPSTEYPYLERMPYGSEVKMISDDTDLAHVYYNGQYGYIDFTDATFRKSFFNNQNLQQGFKGEPIRNL